MPALVSGKAHLSLSSQWPNTIRRSTLRSMWACAFGWCLRLRSPVYEGEHLLVPVHQSVLQSLLIENFHSLTCTIFLSDVSTSLLSCALSQCIVTIIPEAFPFQSCRYIGTITGIGDLDPIRWPKSDWRSLKVCIQSVVKTATLIILFMLPCACTVHGMPNGF
jgi:hypothetical protein